MLITAFGLIVENIPSLHLLCIGGRLAHCVQAWKVITDSKWIINVTRFGYKIPLKQKPKQSKAPTNPTVSPEAHQVLVDEALGLLEKGAIKEVFNEPDEYISSYFAVPKPRSTKFRPILNLKRFNKHIKHYRFKMETFSHVRNWLQPNYFMVGIDLKDQFLSVPINKRFRKYLRFNWLGKLFQWQTLPFGLRCSPRVVTKILKPVMAFLQLNFGILISVYMDDMIIQAKSASECYFHAQITILVLLSLGWEVNWLKTNLIPSQNLTSPWI